MYNIVHDLAVLADAPDFKYGPASVALQAKGKGKEGDLRLAVA